MTKILQAESGQGSTQRAKQWLLDSILHGERAPNSPLRFDALRAASGFGTSALREALIQLEAEEFVTFDLGRGFRTARLTLPELEDINRTRIFAEGQALREAIVAGDVAWEGAILSSLHQLERHPEHGSKAPGSKDAKDWEIRHRAFHHALIAACPSERILRFCRELNLHYQRYRHYIWRHAEAETAEAFSKPSEREHRIIVRFAIQRQADEAVQALTQHYQNNMKKLISICSSHPHILETR